MSGTKIWYCVNCGYETDHRGRCHRCRARLDASPLAELEPGDEEDEVGYRVEEWADADRGRLIVALIRANVAHRFEDDELVVDAEDEDKVDDLLAELRTVLAAEREAGGGEGEEEAEDVDAGDDEEPEADDPTWQSVRALHDAAVRLREDPTDMQADADVAEYSAGVFAAEDFVSIDPDTWAAVGRVTRRLLAALGADEALEDEIRTQAGVLVKLLQPTVDPAAAEDNRLLRGEPQPTHELLAESAAAVPEGRRDHGDVAEEAAREPVEAEPVEADEVAEEAAEAERAGDRRLAKRLRREARSRRRRRRAEPEPEPEEAEPEEAEPKPEAEDEPVDEEEEDEEVTADAVDEEEASIDRDEEEEREEEAAAAAARAAAEVVYELPDWLPEQRANLSVILDAEHVPHEWDGGDLVVAGEHEEEVDAIFARIEGDEGLAGGDEEARYRTLEELFAAADRLAKDPASNDRRQDAKVAIVAADGPTPVGLDDSQWWPIRSRAHNLLEALSSDAGSSRVADEAVAVRNLLRAVV